ncbi:YDG domain-containing protein [Polaromonas sp. YR568]|uniref:YDG domain-containing protein n=1 Tax=Polaromonas sp. YR568 TaxID=1855301 RepID=UPI00398BE556
MKSHASMNRIYRLVWNAALSVWVAVAENAKGRGKGGPGHGGVAGSEPASGFVLHARCRAALGLVLSLAFAVTQQAQAADAANATVSAGAAGVTTVGNTTTVNQSSQRAAIDWTSLSTRANEALVFNQPNAQAIALNRITGSSPSELLGSLTANGQVFILNPNGVLFGAGSQVNVGGLVASTLSMSNADFMDGKHVFTGTGASGSVVNQGTLSVAPGGYLALLAPEVRNEGVMTASLGTALLAAGNKVTLNLDNGSLLGYSIDQGAINALAENKQLIKADGGQVLLSAKAMNSLTTATVNNTGVIEAKTVQNKAGRILLMSDMSYGAVNVAGTLDASAPTGGDGGFIETSAAHVKIADSAVITTRAADGLGGQSGSWLIDPTDFTIAATGGDMTGAALSAQLANNGTVTILNTQGASGTAGDINVNDVVSWNTNGVLTLTAGRDININRAITATGASGGLVLNYGGDYKVKAPITLSGANATLAINGTSYTLIHSMAELDAIDSTGLSGSYALAGDLDASGTTYTGALVGDSNNAFAGTFAGLGHTVSHLTINAGSQYSVGLFSRNSGTIRDLGLVGGSVSGSGFYIGGLVGYNIGGSISNSYATVSVSGSGFYIGGLVGVNYQSSITNSYATGTVTGSSSSNSVGGLVGTNYHANITNSYATGAVTGNNAVGGLVGYNQYAASITNAYATGAVTGNIGVGGLVGSNFWGIIDTTYATGRVSGSRNVGALAGDNVTGAVTESDAGGVKASFWLNSVSTTGIGGGSGLVDGYTRGLTDIEASTASIYTAAGWDVASTGGSSSIWRIYDGKTMPLLRSFMTALTVTSNNVSKTYDGSTVLSNIGYSLSDSSADTSLILGTAAYSTSSKNVGSYAVSTSGLYSGQRGYDISYVGGTADITAATLTVSGGSAANKTYDGTTAATVSGGSLSGLVSGDTVALSQSGSFSDKNAATGKTVSYTSSLSGADARNYVLASAGGTTTADINRAALSISGITASDKTYNASDAATVNTAGASYSGLVAGDVVSVAATGLFSDKNAGVNKTVNLSSSYSGADAGNYVITGQATTTASISRAALTITGITAADKTYDAGTAATVNTAGASYTGLFAGDAVNVSATGVFSDKNAGANKTVNLSSSYSGADAGNYAITSQASTTASINKADLTVQATGASKVYDGTTAANVAFSGNGLAGDALNITGSASFADSNAGINKAVSVTGIAVGGADAGNYNLISGSSASTTADITPKQLTVTANNDTQMSGAPYSGGNGVRYNGLVTGDTAAAVLAGSVAYGGSAQGAYLAGEYDITPGGLLANGNYSLRFVPGRLTLSGGDAASVALGGTALVGAYQTSLNTLSGDGVLAGAFLGDSKGKGDGDAAAAAINAAAAEAAGQDGGN